MSITYLSHSACEEHDMGDHHSESPKRLGAIESAIAESDIGTDLSRLEAPLVERDNLLLAHTESHVALLETLSPESGTVSIDADTTMNSSTMNAAALAAGSVCKAVDIVLEGEGERAFCAVRPPGHHAEADKAMGFCFFDNIAIGAKYALERHDLSRVAIVDFDVHHGNGTEDIVRDDSRICFCSSFQSPFYPGTPFDDVPGHLLPVPLSDSADSADFKKAVTEKWFDALRSFSPELIFISAGFDAHKDDPLANINLINEDFEWITKELVAIANDSCKGRIVSALEGGYNLDVLGGSVVSHLKGLL